MTEHQREFLQMQRAEFSIQAVKGMGDSVREVLSEEVGLKVVNTLAGLLDLAVLSLVEAPYEHMDAAVVLGKNRGDLLAEDHIRHMGDFETAVDGVLVRERDEPHARRAQHSVEFQRIRGARRKIQSPQNPVRRARAMARVDVKVGSCCRAVHRRLLCRSSHC